MVCNDRQLSQAQREAAFGQQRTGVVRAVRPFSGSATVENLIDYINRELGPAVRSAREAVNDVYLQVADNAPSANPLAFYFSTETAAADPTVGRVRLNASPQNTATIMRVSQTNGRLVDVLPWLDVMAGGPTTPLGVVTLVDAINPARFIRWDLNTMTDQGAYWDLGITVIESSDADPFVEDEGVVVGFISGVSAAGSTIPVGSLSPIAADTFIGNITTGVAAPVAVPLASVDSTSIIYDATTHTFQRAALTGAVVATQNSNATLFAGIRDNGSAESDRTNLNFVSATGITATVTDDAGNDELEVRAAWDGTTPLIPDGDKGHIVVTASGATWLWDTTISITGAQTIAPTTNLTLTIGADFLTSAASGINLSAGTHTASAADAGDIALNASGGVAIVAGATPVTGTAVGVSVVADADVQLVAGSDVTINAGTDVVISAGDDLRLNGLGGSMLMAMATPDTTQTTGQVKLNADDSIRLLTGNTERLEIEVDGAWQVAGDAGDAGEVLTSQGASASPAWVHPTSPVLSPAAISADQNNYNPTGWGTARTVRLITNNTTTRTVTGVQAGSAGEIKYLHNIGAPTVNAVILFTLEDTNSDAANRFARMSGTNYVMVDGGAIIWYDGTSSRWRFLSGAGL